MKYLKATFILFTFLLLILACGNGEDQAETEQPQNMTQESTDPNLKAEQERYEELGYTPEGPVEWEKGPTIPIDNVEPGTCAGAAGKFAVALSEIDSASAFEVASDTMDIVVRSLMTHSAQVAQMKRMVEEGFHIVSVAEKRNPEDSTVCEACVTANLKGTDVEDCSFKLRLYPDGKWRVYDFGQTSQSQPPMHN